MIALTLTILLACYWIPCIYSTKQMSSGVGICITSRLHKFAATAILAGGMSTGPFMTMPSNAADEFVSSAFPGSYRDPTHPGTLVPLS